MKKPLLLMIILTIALVLAPYSHDVIAPNSNSEWNIAVDGEVETPLNLTITDLISMPPTNVQASLSCYGAPVTDGEWTGVQLLYVLEQAGIGQLTEFSLNFEASDGYKISSFPMSDALRADVILAYEKDGMPLDEKVRLVVPDANGDVWISLITQITVQALPGVPLTPAMSSPTLARTLPPAPQVQPDLGSSDSSQPAINQTQSSQNTTDGASPQSQQAQNQTILEPTETQSGNSVEQQELVSSPKPLDSEYLTITVVVFVIVVVLSTSYLLVKKKRTDSKQ